MSIVPLRQRMGKLAEPEEPMLGTWPPGFPFGNFVSFVVYSLSSTGLEGPPPFGVKPR